ncbi:DUF493 family protein [Xanthomarina spongicola]|uniref:DUF493 family protein n=1 Tax=Xanthomarina spongicola TaxID=570520 RepID=A0A316E6G8_9FLAO|nr:DUF493 family protein [Xanthomarina spongicola]PWK18540.1 hypothetical protein LX78_01846 [Xanthomarina spongicola]
MNKDKKTKEFYEKLKIQLYDTSIWPTEYLYKFIVKSNTESIAGVEALFNNLGAVIKTTESKNGKYTSISISVKMKSPEFVIEKYIEVSEKVEGVISL